MSQFPSLEPSARSFRPGKLPVNSFSSISGRETRVILGDTMHGHSIGVQCNNVQEPVVKLITDHWYEEQGTALAFTLPASVWAGWSEYSSAITDGQSWRYASEPKVDSVSPGVLKVSVELVSLA